MDFLPGSFGFDPTFQVAPDIAARTLWLDAFVANVDRSWRNPNLLVWHGDLWLIDHGAALYFHHAWSGGITDPARFAAQPYDVGDHVLGSQAAGAAAVDAELADAARRRACSRRCSPRCPTSGSSHGRVPSHPTRCGRRTSPSCGRASRVRACGCRGRVAA